MRAMLDAAREEAAAETRRLLVGEYRGTPVAAGAEEDASGLLDGVCQRSGSSTFRGGGGQVVRLALSVAAKVLQREVSVDPMHLAGTVRAALSRVSDGSSSCDAGTAGGGWVWEQVFAEEHLAKPRWRWLADKAMRLGDCVLETTHWAGGAWGGDAAWGDRERGFRELLEPTRDEH